MPKLRYYLPALLWAALIASLSTSRLPALPTWDLLAPDKIGHLVFYAILTLCLLWAQEKNGLEHFWQQEFLSATLAFGYGACLEGIQACLPHRSFDYADVLANGFGVILAPVIYLWLRKYLP
jgi:VanZ family protein